jgi:hypothetical protein
MYRTLSSLRSFFSQFGSKPKHAALAVCLAFLSSLASLAQTTITTSGSTLLPDLVLGGPAGITFAVANNSGSDIYLTNMQTYLGTAHSGTMPALLASTTSLSGPWFPIDPVQWDTVGIGPQLNVAANGYYPAMGLSYLIPANDTVRFLFYSSTGINYDAAGSTPNTFTTGGVSLLVGDAQINGDNVGVAANSQVNQYNPRFFLGGITYITASDCAGTPTAGTIQGPATICNNGSGFLSLSGQTVANNISYTWFSSTTNGGPYTTPAGSGQFINTGTVSQTTYYVAQIACSGGGTATTPQFTITSGSSSGGVFTIDNTAPTADFNSFTAAINFLNATNVCGGITGSYVFNVTSGQSFNENPPAITVSGTAVNPITFQKSGGLANPIIIGTGSAATTDFVIGINGGDYITFDAIDIGVSGTAQEIGYLIKNATATNGANNNTIRNAKVVMNRTNVNSAGVVVSTSSATGAGAGITPTSTTGANTNNTIQNMIVENVSFKGIHVISASTSFPGINNNIIGCTVGAAYVGTPTGDIELGDGILATSQQNFMIRGNTVRNVAGAGINRGIATLTCMGLIDISKNRVHGIRNTSTTSTSQQAGIDVSGSTVGLGSDFRVYNNFVSDITSAFTNAATATRVLAGITTGTGGANITYQIDHNSVSLDGSGSPNVSSVCLDFSVATSVNIARNNNLANFTGDQFGAAKHYCLESATATSLGIAGSLTDYNNYYLASTVNGHVGFLSTTQDASTIAAWRAALDGGSTHDANSISVNPQYVNNATDLHVQNPALAAEGMPGVIGWALLDIDGNYRPDPPTIGAHELNPVPTCSGTPTAGTINGPTVACTGSSIDLSLAGATTGANMTYQWQLSTTGSTGPWTNVGTGALNYSPTFTAESWYQVVVTCTSVGGGTVTTPVLHVNASPFYICYCSTGLGGSTANCATNISFGAINNTSPSCGAPFYTQYPQTTGLTGEFAQGATYTLSVTTATSSEASAWVDYDRDGVFEASEFTAVYLTGTTGTVQVTIPMGAQLGLTGFRIRTNSTTVDGAGAACNSITTGSTHDFVIEIVEPTECEGDPTPGNTTSSASNVCAGTLVQLGIDNPSVDMNLTYQWQVSNSSQGPWTNFGPNANTATASPAETSWYQLVVTCTSAVGGSTTSVPVQVVVNEHYECYCTTGLGGSTSPCPTLINFGAINNIPPTCASPFYYSYPATPGLTGQFSRGVSYTMTVNTSTTAIVSAWIDYDHNGVFSASEWTQVYTTGTAGSVSITIPTGAQLGITGLRVRSRASGSPNGAGDACLDMATGSTHDHLIEITPEPPCLPANVTVTDVTAYTALVSFTVEAGADYDYEVRTSGAAGSGPAGLVSSGIVTTSPIQLTGLQPGTNYTVHLRGTCPGSPTSPWTSNSFTTPCGIFNVPFVQSFDGIPVSTTVQNLPLCWSVLDMSASSPTSGNTARWNSANGPTTAAYNGLLNGQVMQYVGTATHPADDYLFTPGIQLTGGVSYQLNYDLGHSTASAVTHMTVRYGTSPDIAGIVGTIVAHPPFNTQTAAAYVFYFTPPADGVYYLSWHATWTSGSGSFYLDDVSLVPSPICATVNISATDDCANDQFSVLVAIPSLGDATDVDLTYTLNYGTPVVINDLTGDTLLGPFSDTDIIDISTNDGLANCGVVDQGSFFADCVIEIDCNAATALTMSHCYRNTDQREFTFVANDPAGTLQLKFLQPSPIANGDAITAFDGPIGTNQIGVLVSSNDLSTANGGFIASTTDTLSFNIQADASGSCADGGVAGNWTFQIRCAGCAEPQALFFPVEDCATQTYVAGVDLYDLGFNDVTGQPATTASISYNVVGETPTVLSNLSADFYELGTYPLGTVLEITLIHENDGSCNNVMGQFSVPVSMCPNDEPCQARPLTMNPNYTCVATTIGDLSNMTATGTTTTCIGTPNDDVWYSFVATAPTHRIQILNIAPSTSINHSLFTGACDGTLTLVPGSCATTATSNPTGLTVGQTYLVRVHSAGSTNVTTTFDVCVSAPPEVDMRASALASPPAVACYGPDQTVIVTITNSSWLPIDFAVDPVTVNASTTGGYSSSTVVSTGTLAAGATLNVTMPDLIDMSVAGPYTFNANTATTNDGNNANNAMTAVTRTRVAPVALPITNNFNSYGGTVTTLGTGWNEATGDLAPSGTTSSWTQSDANEDTHAGFGSTNHAKIPMTGTAVENDWIVTPKFIAQAGTMIDFQIGLSTTGTSQNSPPINTNGTHGMQGTSDEVIVRGSTDCGATWFNIYSINASNTVGLTNTFQSRSVDLTAYAGSELIIAFFAKRTATSTSSPTTAGSYDFHLDNVMIQTGAVCSGAPTSGTAASSVAGPVCAPASTSLSVTGQSTTGGIVINWYSSTLPGGPFNPIAGGTTNPYLATGLTQTTYFQAWVKCTLTNDSVATNIVSTVITPTPTASASNDGPVCVGGDVQLTGTTDIGTTFSWTGPNSFNSTDQNPSITDISLAGSGVYTFIATANGCASTPATTNVSVESAPSIDSISADPIAVCNGGTSQLEVVATAALPNMLITEVTLFSSTGDGATPSYPPQLSGTDLDLVELNNASSVPADISGWELTVHPTNSTTVSHEIVFPAGTIVPPNGVVVVHLETTGTTDPANLFFVTGESTSYSSGSALGVVLRNGSTIVDAVGVNTYTFAAGTGVTAADWSGSAPAPSGDAGTTRTGASDTNTGADWTASEFAQQSIGTYNSGYTNPNSGTIGSYSWTPSDVLNDATIANPVASNLTATTTFVVVVSTTAGCTSTDSVTVSVGTPLIVDATSMADTICAGEEVILSSAVSGGGEPYSYSWSPGGATTAEITATPSTTTEFFLTVTDACGVVVTDSVTVVVEPTPTASATATDVQLCAGEALELIGATDIGTVYSWTGPNAFVSTELSPIIPGAGVAASGVYTFIATLGDCASAPATVSIAVDPAPTGVTATATPNPVCAGATVDLSATGIIPAVTIFSEDFEAATNSWTTENLSTGGSSPAAAAWTLRQSPFTAAAQNISSNDASQFYFTDSDAQGSGGTTNTSLTSPAIDLTGYVSADLSFHHYYRHLGSGATGSLATVQVSTDGTNFTDLVVYSSTQGTAASFLNPSIDLDAYVGQATVYIRFKFTGTWDYYWAVDNVTISGGNVPTFAWTSDPAGFASSEQDPADVVVNEETTFTVMVSGPNGCTTSASVLVTINSTDTDSDGIVDCDDSCPTLFGQNGDACDPGPGFMDGVITDCQCVGEEIYVEVTSSVFLDGAYVAADGLMRDDLRTNGYIPATQPYGAAPWSYAGTESIGAGVLTVTGSDAIVDWVLLELRDDTTNTLVIARRAALVQRDGDIVDMDGLSPVKFDEVMPANYYLAVRHRNHLGVMTAATYALSQIPTDIDLTVSTTTTFGTNARRSVAGTFPAMTMWTGNANSNTLVNYSGSANDRTAILNFLGAATFLTPQAGYNSQDVNMNGVVTYSGSNNDRTTLLNSLGASTFLTPIVEQLP